MNTEQDNITESTSKVQPGTLLKAKREALGLSQKQVADRLRLRVTIIQNIEENNFNSDLVATFTRGYLRSYAKAVGLPEHQVLDAFEDSVEQPQEQTMQSFSKKTKRDKHDSRIMTITWMILLVIIGMSSLWWWQNNERDTLTPDSNAEAVSVVEEQAATSGTEDIQPDFNTIEAIQDEAVSGAQPAQEPSGDEMATEDPVSTEQEVPEAEVAQPVAETAAETTNDDLLRMNFRADCWIQVKDATGKTLSTGIKKAGDTLDLRGQKPLQVILGAPESVSITFASEPVDLSGYTSGKVARFTLP